jgi:xanthine dehydrogenase small subunit
VQQSLVACHGSQCGFCTPGFVMSLWSCYESHQQAGTVPTRQQLADDLSGNLCRCTGYRPILEAGQQMFGPAPVRLQRQPVVDALLKLSQDPPLHTAQGFHAPRTVSEFAALRESKPRAKVLAGSTDMGLWVTKQFKDLGELISINKVAELRRVTVGDGHIVIGAGASLEAAWRALVAEWPSLRDVWLRFASLPIRPAGTMGGNVANGSPIGDSAPALMALGASIVLQRGTQTRRLALEDFYLDYMLNALLPGEFVHSMVVPPQPEGTTLRAYKISKRFDCDISALCAALAIRLDGDRVAQARFVYGGMAAIVRHAAKAEAAVIGQSWTEATARAAMAALAEDFTPLTDMRASAAYRLEVAQNLLLRLWHETRTDAPLDDAAVNVWHRTEEVMA